MAADPRKKNNPHTGYMMFFLLLLIVVAALILLLPVYRKYQKRQGELVQVNTKLNTRKIERAELNREVSGLQNSPAEVEKVAREKFGLVREGETVMKYKKTEEKTKDDKK
jgi:cell division protein FtsB